MRIPFFETAEKRKQRLLENDLRKWAKEDATNAKRSARQKVWDNFWFKARIVIGSIAMTIIAACVYVGMNIPQSSVPSVGNHSLVDTTPQNKTALRQSDRLPETKPPQPTKSSGSYWLNTSTRVRHNSGCKYFGDTSKGRACSKADGAACKICGG